MHEKREINRENVELVVKTLNWSWKRRIERENVKFNV